MSKFIIIISWVSYIIPIVITYLIYIAILIRNTQSKNSERPKSFIEFICLLAAIAFPFIPIFNIVYCVFVILTTMEYLTED